MLTWPWICLDVASDVSCTVIAGRLPLRSHRDLVAVAGWVRRLRGEVMTTPGLAGHGSAIDLSPALWTVSAWTNRADLVRFGRGTSHQAAVVTLRRRFLPATFVVWTCPSIELPVQWTEVRKRLAAAGRPG